MEDKERVHLMVWAKTAKGNGRWLRSCDKKRVWDPESASFAGIGYNHRVTCFDCKMKHIFRITGHNKSWGVAFEDEMRAEDKANKSKNKEASP